jgi:predicted enzyme related to lactoylglutathione lyase
MQANGFVFFEIYVVDLAHYKAIFADALGMKVLEDEPDFVKLASAYGTVLLNSMVLPATHPFARYRDLPSKGMGVEMGIVTTDLDAAQARAKKLDGCVVSDIVHQEWGMSDFRIQTREGYYFRVTTPDPEATFR